MLFNEEVASNRNAIDLKIYKEIYKGTKLMNVRWLENIQF